MYFFDYFYKWTPVAKVSVLIWNFTGRYELAGGIDIVLAL
jgi:hypothetical protein